MVVLLCPCRSAPQWKQQGYDWGSEARYDVMLPLVQHKVFTNFPFDIFEAKVSINMRAFPGKRRVQRDNGEVVIEDCNIKQELLLSVQVGRNP